MLDSSANQSVVLMQDVLVSYRSTIAFLMSVPSYDIGETLGEIVAPCMQCWYTNNNNVRTSCTKTNLSVAEFFTNNFSYHSDGEHTIVGGFKSELLFIFDAMFVSTTSHLVCSLY